MKRQKNILIVIIVFIVFLQISCFIKADQIEIDIKIDKEGTRYIYTNLFTHHWNYNPEHNNDQELIGLEYYFHNDEFGGIAYFKNSFHQPCYSIYLGKYFRIYDGNAYIIQESNGYGIQESNSYRIQESNGFRMRGKILAGIIHGYDDENGRYDGVLNKLGTFPFVAPQIGVEYKGMTMDIMALADAGVMITFGVEF